MDRYDAVFLVWLAFLTAALTVLNPEGFYFLIPSVMVVVWVAARKALCQREKQRGSHRKR
jgi:hypothetical protein